MLLLVKIILQIGLDKLMSDLSIINSTLTNDREDGETEYQYTMLRTFAGKTDDLVIKGFMSYHTVKSICLEAQFLFLEKDWPYLTIRAVKSNGKGIDDLYEIKLN